MELYHNNKYEIGIDEAGRGPFFGSVYAGAVILGDIDTDNDVVQIINDSKKLSKKKRRICEEWIKENVLDYGVGYATAEEIDEMNILEATKLAMNRAINNLTTMHKELLVIDGVRWENKFDIESVSIVKGDATYLNIACASILAKEEHDRHIEELCKEHPELNEHYDLLKNMGYGTKKHIEGIKKHGFSNYHRKTFKIKQLQN